MAAFNPQTMLAERACAPIYNAIDTGNSLLAIKHADKVLASQPSLSLASALKTIALVRTGKKKDAGKICDELLKRDLTKSGDDAAIHPLTWSLSRLGRSHDEIALLERISKVQPNNEDIARQAVIAMIKYKQYQKAQQTSFKMHKAFDGSRSERKARWQYFWWSIQSYLLLSRRSDEPGAALALPLCERMIANHEKTQPLDENAEEELALQISVMTKQGKKADAFALLSASGSPADQLCSRNLGIEFLRRELAEELGEWAFVRAEAKEKLQAGSRNWAHVLAYVKASSHLGNEDLASAGGLIDSLASSEKGKGDRSARLAQLELLKARLASSQASGQSEQALGLIAAYFEAFGTKPCCHEDVIPYLPLLSEQHGSELCTRLEKLRKALPVQDEKDLRWNINISKLQRSLLPASRIELEEELRTASARLEEYLQGLEVDLPETEMQPADDLALLACQSLISAYALATKHSASILQHTIALLEFACSKSKKGYQLRMLLIRCYLIAGCYDRASIHYNLIGIKAIQNDTLSHLLSDRMSTFAACASVSSNDKLADTGFKLLVNKVIVAAEEIYAENAKSTPEMIVKCMEHGTFSRVEEFVEFGEKIERSMQRQAFRIEAARCKSLQLALGKTTGENKQRLEKETLSLAASVKKDLAQGCHDQRDFDILPNFQPLGSASIIEQTSLGPVPRVGWLRCMQQLCDSIGPIERSDEDVKELTLSEREMFDLVVKRRCGSQDSAAAIDKFFSSRRTRTADLCTSLLSGNVRPFDLLHLATTTLEAYALLFATPAAAANAASEDKETARAHVGEMATLLDDLSHKLAAQPVTASSDINVLDTGLAALGKDKVESLKIQTAENTSKSFRKVLDATRDALRAV